METSGSTMVLRCSLLSLQVREVFQILIVTPSAVVTLT